MIYAAIVLLLLVCIYQQWRIQKVSKIVRLLDVMMYDCVKMLGLAEKYGMAITPEAEEFCKEDLQDILK
jgi:hypothetical protein